MRKIVFLSSSLSYGGAEKMLCFVANELTKRNYHVVVINLMEHRDDSGRLNKNVKVIDLEPLNIRYLDRLDQEIKLIRYLRRIKPDVIVSFKFKPNYLSVIAGKLLNIPVIISERCDPSREYILKGRDGVYWKIINTADGGVFQTPGAMQFYSYKLRRRGVVIPKPMVLDTDICHTVRDNDKANTVVSVGRLSNVQKRYDVMLNAFKIFSDKYKNYSLKIFGDGEDEQNIQKLVSELKLDCKVFLEGRTEHPLQEMDNADIFLTTSDYEGISNSLLEAMAIGMPVVATDCSPGGARMLIQDGINGLLVPCGNVEVIANALERMAKDYHLRNRCGKKAKSVTRKYNAEDIMQAWQNYIEKVIHYHTDVLKR